MRSITADVIAVLEAGGLTVGDATGQGLTPPYVVAYPLGDLRDGSIGQPWERIRAGYQFTCVGGDRWQAEWLHDKCVELMIAASQSLGHVQVEPSGAIARDDDTGGPSIWMAYPRFTVWQEAA